MTAEPAPLAEVMSMAREYHVSLLEQHLGHGHYWVSAQNDQSGDTLVLDITADQFGVPPVIILTLEEAYGRYYSRSSDEIREHVVKAGLAL